MTSLTTKEWKQRFFISDDEVYQYIKKKKLPFTAKSYGHLASKVRKSLRASKIKHAPGTGVTISYGASPWQIIYGKMKVGGNITYAGTRASNQRLDMIITLAGHQITSIIEMWLDDERVIFGGTLGANYSSGLYHPERNSTRAANNNVYLELNDGNPANGAIATLVSNSPAKWTTNHKQSNRAHAYVVLRADPVLFPNGLPEATFVVRGKPVYDPRTGTTATEAENDNAALCILDYLTNTVYGMGVPLAECETGTGVAGSFKTAADICSESVATVGGPTEPRYRVNGAWSSDASDTEVLDKMASAMAGTVTFCNGKWKCWPGAWTTPTITLTEADTLSDLTIETKVSRQDSFNGVRGTFTSPLKGYVEDDFPTYKNDYYTSLDNNERVWEDVQLPLTHSPTACQRISKIFVEETRQQITVNATFGMKAFQAELNENIYLTNSRMGWNAKAFRIIELQPVVDNDAGGTPRFAVEMKLKETASGIYNWDSGSETQYDLAQNTELPNPFFCDPVTNLACASGTAQLYVTQDGTVVSRIRATWDQATDGFASSGGSIELDFKRSVDSTYVPAIILPVTANEYYILDVQDGWNYDVRVRVKNSLGVYSDYATVLSHLVIGKTAPPSNVAGVASSLLPYGIVLGWGAVSDLDIDYYQIKVGSIADTWATMTPLAQVGGTTYEANLRPAGTYKFAVKAVDTSGNESLAEAVAEVVIGAPSTPVVTVALVDNALLLTWTNSSGQFAIANYIVRYGTAFAGGTDVGVTAGNTYRETVQWGGSRTYWVAAVDVAGNISTAGAATVSISSPSIVQTISAQPVDNNVLLRWTAPAISSLAIDHYKIYKGDTFGGAQQIGQVTATFAVLFETVGGTFTYWIVAFDTAGNQGATASVTAVVNQPPDYVLRDVQTLDASNNTSSYFVLEEGTKAYGGTDTTVPWDSHFSSEGWTSINDQIAAGLPYFLQPGTSGSGLEWDDIDYGALLPSTIVTLTADILEIDGDTSWLLRLYHSTDGVSYTQASPQNISDYARRWLVPAFRYLRVNIDATSFSGDDAIYEFRGAELRLDVKQNNDSGGPESAPSTDTTTTATITIAGPAVITATAHGMVEGQQFELTTTGALPTGLSTGVIYFCRSPSTNTFNVSTAPDSTVITTTGTQSGTHTVLRRGKAVFFNRAFIDIEGLSVTPTPTPAQRTANLPFIPVVSFKDTPYNTNFNVEIYDINGGRVACDFRWTARGI